jgi:ribose transport system substrate-binding protein
MKNWVLSLAVLALLVGCKSESAPEASTTTGTTPPTSSGEKKTIAFVTNNASAFWTIAHKGTDKAQAELPNYTIEFQIPSEGSAAEQKRILDDLVAKGVVGIAVRP